MKFGNLNYFEKTKNFKLPRTEVLKQTRNGLFLKMDHSLPLFYFFCLFYKQLTVNMFNKSCRWMDSNPGPLVSEATTLSTVPQPLPTCLVLLYKVVQSNRSHFIRTFFERCRWLLLLKLRLRLLRCLMRMKWWNTCSVVHTYAINKSSLCVLAVPK